MDLSPAAQALAEGRAPDALKLLERALAQDPHRVDALHAMGLALHQLGRTGEAVRFVIEAHLAVPEDEEILRNLSIILVHMHRLDKATETLRTLLDRNPSCVISMGLLGSTLTLMGRHEEAHPWLEKAEAADPGNPARRSALLLARAAMAEWDSHADDRARLEREVATALADGREPPCSAFGAVMMGLGKTTIRAIARAQAPRATPRTAAPPARDRIRVGYLSPDLHNHPVGILLAPMLEHHDRTRFDVRAYGLRTIEDRVRARIEAACSQVFRFDDQDDATIASRIAEDAPDVLVDLVGFTNAGRPGVLARRPAPVQVHFLGYPGTIPGGIIDYHLLHSSRLGPSGRADYDEAVVCLPETFIACEGFDRPEHIPSRAELGLPEDRFVFAFFGATYRVEPRVFDAWAEILGAAPDSVLWIQNGHRTAQENLRKEAGRRGIDPARLIFGQWGLLSEKWHHTRCDLWLDGWHVSSGTASIVAAWTGTPLLTLAGDAPQSRTGAGVNAGAGLADALVVETPEAYVTRAIELARDPDQLAALRTRLETARDAMPLFDVPRFTRHFELALVEMVERARRGVEPKGFDVPVLPPIVPGEPRRSAG